jgi:hypothetical protein
LGFWVVGRGQSVFNAIEQGDEEADDSGAGLSGEMAGSTILVPGNGYRGVFAFPVHDRGFSLFLSCAGAG